MEVLYLLIPEVEPISAIDEKYKLIGNFLCRALRTKMKIVIVA